LAVPEPICPPGTPSSPPQGDGNPFHCRCDPLYLLVPAQAGYGDKRSPK
jgi:hypothetical protein